MALHSANRVSGHCGGHGHGHYQVRLLDQFFHRGNVAYAGLLGQGTRPVAAIGEARDHVHLVFPETLADGMAHIARTQNGHGVDIHHSYLSNETLSPQTIA